MIALASVLDRKIELVDFSGSSGLEKEQKSMLSKYTKRRFVCLSLSAG